MSSTLEELFRFGKSVTVAIADSSSTTQISEADTAALLITLEGGTLTAARAGRLAQRQDGALWYVRNNYTFDVDITCGSSDPITVPAGELMMILLEPT